MNTKVANRQQTPLGIAIQYHQAGKYAAAVKAYQKVLKQQSNNAVALVNLGAVLHKLGHLDKGLAYVDKGLTLQPHHPDFHFNRAMILFDLKRYQEAIDHYQITLQHYPHDAEALYEIASCYQRLQQYMTALDFFKRSSDLAPTAQVFIKAGEVYASLLRTEAAITCFLEAIRQEPDNVHSYCCLADAYLTLQKISLAYEACDQGLQRNSKDENLLKLMIKIRQYANDWRYYQQDEAQLKQFNDQSLATLGIPVVKPFDQFPRLWPQAYKYHSVEVFAASLSKQYQARNQHIHFEHKKLNKSILKIAYISCGFHDHPMGHILYGSLQCHDRKNVEVFIYSYGVNDESDFRHNLIAESDHFIDIRDLSAIESAQRIYDDNIDVLIDLSGWLLESRMEILSLHPAPVQIGYLGYPGTIGCDFLDYYIADLQTILPEEEKYFSETIVRLPNSYWLMYQDAKVAEVSYTRQDFGLPEHSFVFTTFNYPYKYDPEIFACWMDILTAVPDSVLWIFAPDPLQQQNLAREAEQANVDSSRLIFAEKMQKSQHLARLPLADLFLDNQLVNAHTTAADCLWMGVPLLAYRGDEFVRRVTTSMLTAANLPQMIATDLTQYADKAIYYATHQDELDQVKQTLLAKDSPLFDTQQTIVNLEAVYRQTYDAFVKC